MTEPKIGDQVWIYESHRRRYHDPVTGERSRSPIERLSYERHYIVGETRVSWIVNSWRSARPDAWGSSKIKKADVRAGQYPRSWAEVLERVHGQTLGRRLADALFARVHKMTLEQMRRVAAAMDYDLPPTPQHPEPPEREPSKIG